MPATPSVEAVAHLKTSGTSFTYPDGRPFAWRGITAFRLLEMEAAGRAGEVDAYLRWASRERLTVVRVLAMAKHLFELPPNRGAAALDGLLTRANRHGIYVEVVSLADTASYELDAAAHVKRLGDICARHANAIIEIANEPYHGTQAGRVHDGAYLASLRAIIPREIPVALGAAEYPALFDDADYVTVHFPRASSANGWGWVARLRDGAEFLRRARKPVIDDEPIGADERGQPGRRDNDPERFRAAALAGRLMGLGATFHYEGGLQARLPRGRELECFNAWSEAWTLLPGVSPVAFTEPGSAGSPVRGVSSPPGAAVFAGARGRFAWVLIGGGSQAAAIEWADGWSPLGRHIWAHSQLYSAVKRR